MICRKCRREKPLGDLQKVNGVYRCASSCKRKGWDEATNQRKELGNKKQNHESKQEKPKYEFGEIPDILSIGKTTNNRQRRYVITCAVSNSPVDKEFLATLENYCNQRSADLIVIPIRYNFAGEQAIWDGRIQKYFCSEGRELNNNLLLLGDINIRPTAVTPLSGMQGIGQDKTVIVPHPKIQLSTIPTPHNKLPKIMLTTGAITKPRYTPTKEGYKAQFHHSLGAVIVEVVDDRVFHFRHLHFKDGSLIDLDTEYFADGGTRKSNALGLVLGDAHVDFFCPKVFKGTFSDRNSLVKLCKPEHLIWHDLLDQFTRNHHHRSDPFIAIAKNKGNRDSVIAELRRVTDFLERVDYVHEAKHIIVGSNHNEALSRWIRETDWKEDPENAETYLKIALKMVESARMESTGAAYSDAFRLCLDELLNPFIDRKILGSRESFCLKDIELGYHGHDGANGSRGNIRQFARSGSKFIVGHSHQSGIYEGAYQVGTSSILDMAYVKGLSAAINSHCLIHPNGKRQLIHLIDGQFTDVMI